MLAGELGLSARSVSRYMHELRKMGLILWLNGTNSYRHVWAKEHPDVKPALQLPYRGGDVSKKGLVRGCYVATPLRQIGAVARNPGDNMARSVSHSGEVASPDWLHSNRDTRRDSNEDGCEAPLKC